MNRTLDVSNNDPGAETLLEMFRKATLIKLCDERLRAVIRSGRMMATHYSPRGQEMISAAMAVNLRRDDYVLTIYRGLHDHVAHGVPLRELWAEYAGRATGACKGKGGPMHITQPDAGIVVTTGIVGSGIPIANGFAWASKLKGEDKVTVVNFGDGASNIGAFHEGLNMASVWKLPVVFLCHNNQYSEHTKLEYCTAVRNIADRGVAYSMPSVTVDGNDAVAIWRACRDAVQRAREGGGPTLVEAMTYRFEGHVFGDSGDYMPADEVAAARLRDPMPRIRATLIERGHAAEADLLAIEVELTAQIDDAVDFALASPFPDPDEIERDVYAMEGWS